MVAISPVTLLCGVISRRRFSVEGGGRGEALSKFLPWLTGCWRSLEAWRSASMFTRLTPWLRSEKTTLAGPMCECALVGMKIEQSLRLLPAHPLTPPTPPPFASP